MPALVLLGVHQHFTAPPLLHLQHRTPAVAVFGAFMNQLTGRRGSSLHGTGVVPVRDGTAVQHLLPASTILKGPWPAAEGVGNRSLCFSLETPLCSSGAAGTVSTPQFLPLIKNPGRARNMRNCLAAVSWRRL